MKEEEDKWFFNAFQYNFDVCRCCFYDAYIGNVRIVEIEGLSLFESNLKETEKYRIPHFVDVSSDK